MAGIPIDQAPDAVKRMRSRFEKGFRETQGRRAHNIYRYIDKHAKTVTRNHKYEFTVRTAAAPGTVGFLQAYDTIAYQLQEYVTQGFIKPVNLKTHTNMLFDMLVDAVTDGDPANRLWRDYETKRSAGEETKRDQFESIFIEAPQSLTGSNAFMGLLTWFARSMTPGGAFVEQLTPAKNGVYRRLGDGTIVSSVANVDAALARNERMRSWVATFDGKMGKVLLDTMHEMIYKMGYEYAEEYEGIKPNTSRLGVLWSDILHSQYMRYMDDIGAPRSTDFMSSGGKTVQGVRPIGCSYLDGHNINPIFLIFPDQVRLHKLEGYWGKPIYDKTIGPLQWGEFQVSIGQMVAEDPGTAGGLIHSRFTTGT
jgi:hypothetical protein